MRKIVLLLGVFLGSGFLLSVFAQEQEMWKIEQLIKQQSTENTTQNTYYSQQEGESEFIAFQDNKQKDPEIPETVEPITAKQEIIIKEEGGTVPDELLQRPGISTTSENTPLISAPITGQEKTTTQEVKTDDSVLGFNFLYFLIHKFKISEIMD